LEELLAKFTTLTEGNLTSNTAEVPKTATYRFKPPKDKQLITLMKSDLRCLGGNIYSGTTLMGKVGSKLSLLF
jgi:hypothetical protein